MNDITLVVDEGSQVLVYFYKSTNTAKDIMAQAVHEGYVTLPRDATSSNGGHQIERESYMPLGRIVLVR